MLLELIKGAAPLLALCLLQGLNLRLWRGHERVKQLVSGLLFGSISIFGMVTTIHLLPGVIFDARSVVLSMAGLFGGPVVGGIACLVTAIYRIWLGGSGAGIGVVVIVVSTVLGLLYRHGRHKGWVQVGMPQLLAFGLLLHGVVVILFTQLPAEVVAHVMAAVAAPFIFTLAPTTVLFGMLLLDIENRFKTEAALKLSEARLRAIGSAIPDTLLVVDEEGRHIAVMSSDESQLYTTSAKAIGQTLHEIFPQEEADRFLQVVRKTLDGTLTEAFEYELETLSGRRVFEGRGQPIDGVIDGKRAIVFLARDITTRKNTEALLRQTMEELNDIANSIPVVVYRYRRDEDGTPHLLYISEKVAAIWGVSAADAMRDPQSLFARIHPDDIDHFAQADLEAATTRSVFSHNYRVILADGRVRWLHAHSTPKQEDNGAVLYNGFVEDITERILADDALRASEERYRLAFHTSPDAITITRQADGLYLDINTGFERISGWRREEVVGRKSLDINVWHDMADRQRLLTKLAATGYCENLEAQFVMKDGRIITGLMSAHVVDMSGEPCVLSITRDISDRIASEEEIKHLAFFDALTKLPNRRLLQDRLRHALASCARTGSSGALLFIDLDDFKTLNDTLGHDKGDLLLQQVAERLVVSLREGDTISRIGGDEFVVLLEDLSELPLESAAQTEAVATKLLTAIMQPFDLGGGEYLCSASIGIALFNDQQAANDELMKRADLAMYQAKAAGRNTLRFFDPDMQSVITARVALEAGMREALRSGQFLLYYQPQVDSAGTIIGAEALLRWQHPHRGLVFPDSFIPLAEENGMILPLGRWVLATACAQLVAWAVQPDTAHLTLAINVSARQFRQHDFVEIVLAELEQSGANPERLKLELTESLLLDNLEDTIEKMTLLKDKGLSFALDDFGTGYSSLSYLKRLPLGQLKVDRSFVRDVLTDPNDAAIAKTIVALAQSLGLMVIAEGVETEEQRTFLVLQGCQNFQGYLFSRPLPLAEFNRLPNRI